ncbi:response regulator [bacterium]|nr:MAG: response regulator [bacterium]
MMIILMLVSVGLFVLADWLVRELLRRRHEGVLRAERSQALAESVKLDFSREAKSLKRVEVKEPVGRVLCVDDEAVVLEGFRRILALAGWSVDTVESGQEALGLLRVRHYDFVFTDLRMPAMDGVEVCKAVKHVRPDIDVVIVTGYASVETAVECMKHGASDYIQKPFTEDELLAFVKKALLRRTDRIQRELQPRVRVTHDGAGGVPAGGEFAIPGGVLISSGHCWASLAQDGTAKVGLDDFAAKLLGKLDTVELPPVGLSVRVGQPLFSARAKNRRAQFFAPLSGKVVRVNAELGADAEPLSGNAYDGNWVCVIDGSDLDKELGALKVGKAAVALFEEDIARLKGFLKEGSDEPEAIRTGILAELGEPVWERGTKEFFSRG